MTKQPKKLLHFSSDSADEITAAIKEKKIKGVAISDEMNSWLIFQFTDGTELHIKYDWIYEWGMR